MRPPRILIAGVFFVATVFVTFLSLRSSHPPRNIATSSHATSRTGIQSLFAFRAPFSLFPPNAIITLTNDNTTAFLARPAAFGPPLPSDGLKGQVWIGSGFGDDNIRQGAVTTVAEGELGCSDVPGWADSYAKTGAAAAELKKSTDSKTAKAAAKTKSQKRATKDQDDGPFDDQPATSEESSHGKNIKGKPSVDDGTDDYLHHPLPESTVSRSSDKAAAESKGDHADIQSIQEGAEITGKVVLLSRGGCGFVEKVKWAQRRGAIALIVGDNEKGGPLIQMYARGDTSNITIPSVFTSRTTAHLLSSLVGPGSFIEDVLDENGKPALKVQHTDKSKKGKKHRSHPTFTPTTAATKPTGTSRAASKAANKKAPGKTEEVSAITTEKPGWLRSLFLGSKKNAKKESSRPPSSGQLDWVLVDEWKDDDSAGSKKISTKPAKKADTDKKSPKPSLPKSKPSVKATSGDDFVIGVQDWRDPDLVGAKDTETESGKTPSPAKNEKSHAANKNAAPQPTGKKPLGGTVQEIPESLRGGSITPGSGEYDTKGSPINDKENAKDGKPEVTSTDGSSKGLLTTIFGDDEENVEFLPPGSHEVTDGDNLEEDEGDYDDEDEGLWVTITPTSGASPFLDTLLVLVVSPLVTLTVVYALLLIRSRIRRRRWRAPKSVVERLPVRTYQTIVSGSQSPRTPSPNSSSVTTPLLQHSPSSRPRPRSRTTTGVPEPGDLIRVNSNPLQVPAIPPRALEHEKNASESSEWRKHMGKQVECVVCLEEYVDGVSRVMSLPCGHEFHADCITPWLTTRRRTCPICKGDVVRSLARGSPSSPRYEPYRDDSDDDYQTQAAETVNTSQTSALPIPGSLDGEHDLEQGITSPSPTRPQRTDRPASWRELIVGSMSSTRNSPAPAQEDRNR
ncbi:related to PA and RING finger domain protein [Phialocephala subalpina]|uniref:Related to PA and RING finger domain protein n=1 Tax=Phialocephala subalpina TaxID=576137 RepID=A0A1L7XFX9_9HELO|nr:related to PA and RING finger domain protein [Phialocephala subalpina]